MKFFEQVLPASLLLMAATACAEGTSTEMQGVISRDQASTPVTETSDSKGEEPNVHDANLESLAIDTLAKKLSVSPKQVSMLSMTARDWPDSSLGCPQPGVSYLQVITPGYQATMSAGGKTYSVHMTSKYAVVCEKLALMPRQAPKPAPDPGHETE